MKMRGTNVTQAGGKGGKYPFYQTIKAKRVLTTWDQNRVTTILICFVLIANLDTGVGVSLVNSGETSNTHAHEGAIFLLPLVLRN